LVLWFLLYQRKNQSWLLNGKKQVFELTVNRRQVEFSHLTASSTKRHSIQSSSSWKSPYDDFLFLEVLLDSLRDDFFCEDFLLVSFFPDLDFRGVDFLLGEGTRRFFAGF